MRAHPGLARPEGVRQTLEIFSDPWAFALLQETFFGVRRFDDFQRHLAISRNVLTKRLKALVDHRILVRKLYQRRPDRYEYRLTDRGRALYPIFVTMDQWGQRWLQTGPPAGWEAIHGTCGSVLRPRLICEHCGESVDAHDMRIEVGEEQ